MLPAAYDVTDKVVFITGAGRGIGEEGDRRSADRASQVVPLSSTLKV